MQGQNTMKKLKQQRQLNTEKNKHCSQEIFKYVCVHSPFPFIHTRLMGTLCIFCTIIFKYCHQLHLLLIIISSFDCYEIGLVKVFHRHIQWSSMKGHRLSTWSILLYHRYGTDLLISEKYAHTVKHYYLMLIRNHHCW